jgi:O-antigen ligase
MPYLLQLLAEAGTVGAVLAVCLLIANYFYPLRGQPERVLVASLVVGPLIHILFEILQLNRMYCTTGAWSLVAPTS